ncbi:MAG: sigma-70 family RNA polymerase sigma factor [Candidatus Melainabacteria bacterium]|nr:sigma-70 family RNA polymerase sigma factor [Candidatus Melainabacteria bacterium]
MAAKSLIVATGKTPAKPSRTGTPKMEEEKPAKAERTINDYVELIETVARVEYSRLPNHLIDFTELVNIGAIALHVLFTSNPDREYNVTYLSTAIKWAIRNELRYRYKWYSLRQVDNRESEPDAEGTPNASAGDDDFEMDKGAVREVVYETILSMDSMLEAENPTEIRDDSHTPEENTELKEMARVVREAIAKLPEREKQIIEARFYKNMKMREIGAAFNISPSRTSRIVQSGLDKIKLELQRRGFA